MKQHRITLLLLGLVSGISLIALSLCLYQLWVLGQSWLNLSVGLCVVLGIIGLTLAWLLGSYCDDQLTKTRHEFNEQTKELMQLKAETTSKNNNTDHYVHLAMLQAETNILILNCQHNLVFANNKMRAWLDSLANGADFIGKPLEKIFPNGKAMLKIIETLENTYFGETEFASKQFKVIYSPIFNEKKLRIGTILECIDRTQVLKIEADLKAILDNATQGKFDYYIPVDETTGFFKGLSEAVNGLVSVTRTIIDETAQVLGETAQGNLTRRFKGEYQGKYAELRENVNSTLERLNAAIAKMRKSGLWVAEAANNLAQGNNDLSQRTEQQSSSLAEITANIQRLAVTVKETAQQTSHADQLASSAVEHAKQGGKVVGQVVAAMGEINNSSKKIADIIGVIDDIAFQTNLLALNAAVEAARAGEQGRGFAVVASEVRSLAQRSANAAKEIKGLIKESVEKVEGGTELVGQSGKTLDGIVDSVVNVNEIIKRITGSAKQQASGIEEVTRAVSQMDKMTQQNAILVEQAAIASETMNRQAQTLIAEIEIFGISQDGGATSASSGKATYSREAISSPLLLNNKAENTVWTDF
ncbi:MAG: methyl-accepting chemotaxis protein [Gammaproteobacteria bacterium]